MAWAKCHWPAVSRGPVANGLQYLIAVKFKSPIQESKAHMCMCVCEQSSLIKDTRIKETFVID